MLSSPVERGCLLRFAVTMALVLCAAAAPAKVALKSDRFSGETTVRSEVDVRRVVDGKPSVAVVATYKETGADGLPRAPEIALLVHFAGEHWRYLNCYTTHWLADGQRVTMPEAQHTGDVGRASVFEQIVVGPFALDTLRVLMSAAKVEYKICNDVYALAPDEKADLATVYRMLTTKPAMEPVPTR